jgi:hypothetical protein
LNDSSESLFQHLHGALLLPSFVFKRSLSFETITGKGTRDRRYWIKVESDVLLIDFHFEHAERKFPKSGTLNAPNQTPQKTEVLTSSFCGV